MHRLKFFFLILFSYFLAACDQTPKPEKTLSLANDLFSANLSENYALLGTTEGAGELWDIKGKPSLIHQWKHTDENSGIIATDISPSEEYAITAEKDSIAWWRISDGVLLSVWGLPNIKTISISPDGQFALIGLADKAIYLALEYGQTLYAFEHTDMVLTTDISDSGLYAITGSDDQTAKLWDLTTGELKYTWQHRNKLSTVVLSKDDKYALTNAALSQTRLWKISNGKLRKAIGPKLITLSAAEFSKNNKYLLTGHTTQRIDLWDVKTGNLIKFWRPKKEADWRPTAATILSLNFTANSKKFYSIASNGFLQKWRK